jgi:uncharacterized protein (DUF2062 family)
MYSAAIITVAVIGLVFYIILGWMTVPVLRESLRDLGMDHELAKDAAVLVALIWPLPVTLIFVISVVVTGAMLPVSIYQSARGVFRHFKEKKRASI